MLNVQSLINYNSKFNLIIILINFFINSIIIINKVIHDSSEVFNLGVTIYNEVQIYYSKMMLESITLYKYVLFNLIP